MLSNTLANNDVAMETGGGTNGTCLGNVFAGNTVTGRTTGSVLKWSPGMVLRCAENMKIYSNTFNYFDWWTFDIAMRSFMPLGLKGMSIYSNTIRQHFDMIYCLEVAPKTAGYGISSNSNSYQGAFAKSWSGALLTKATFTALTGFPG
jgi:hypothetical protein